MDRYVFCKNVKVLFNEKKVIIGNALTGHWIKISKECYDIIQEGIQKKMCVEDVIKSFEDNNDKKYLQNLYNCLFQMEVLRQENAPEPLPQKNIVVALTHKCNLKCKHCFVSASPEMRDELSFDEIIKIVDKICKSKVEYLAFTGGEPLVRRDILEILRYTRNHFLGKICLMTNGTMITNENVKEIVGCVDSIDISIDGVDEETCSQIRGKNVFNKVIHAIELLHEEGFTKISLSMVLTKENIIYEKKFDELNKKLGTSPMKRKFSPIGRGAENREKFEIKLDLNEKPILDIKAAQQEVSICHCGALTRTLYIGYDGYIYPCNTLDRKEYSLGKIEEYDSIDAFYESCCFEKNLGYKKLEEIFPENFEKCKKCNVNLFCWECLHFIDMVKSGVESISNCEKRKKELQEIVWNN